MKRLFRWVLVIDVMLVNFVIGYLVYQNFQPKPVVSQNLAYKSPINSTEYVDKCGVECQKYIDDKLAQVTPQPTQKTGTVVVVPTRAKTRTITYVTIPGSGNSNANEWTTLSGTDFYFDTRDYPGIKEVYFEANMRLFNGNGVAYIRLYDSTHGVGVQGSDVSTTVQADTLVTSGRVSFWSGKNLIKVQAKSLTADTSVFSSGRLRIVSEN